MTNKEKLIQMLTKNHIIVDDFTEQCGHNFTGLLNSNMLVYLDLYNSGVKYFIVIAQNQIYSLIDGLHITLGEGYILKGISCTRYHSSVSHHTSSDPMWDPLLNEQQRIFHKVSVDKTKLNKFIQFVKNEIAEIEQYTK